MNKFDKLYSQKSTAELLEKILGQRIHGDRMEAAWYDGLVAHLRQRQLTEEQAKLFQQLLSANPAELRHLEEHYKKQNEALADNEVLQSTRYIDPSGIIAAGKSLKYMAVLIVFVQVIGIVMLCIGSMHAYELLPGLGMVVMGCGIVALILLYSAGKNLEKSVKWKPSALDSARSDE